MTPPSWRIGDRVRVIGTTEDGTVEYVATKPGIRWSVRVTFPGGATKTYRPHELQRVPTVGMFGKVGP